MIHILLLPTEVYQQEILKEGKRGVSGQVVYDQPREIPAFSDIQLLHQRGLLNIKTRIANSSQSELVFLGKVSKDFVVGHIPVYFPNFDKGKKFVKGYHDVVFGIDGSATFKRLQNKFAQNIDEATKEVVGIMEKHLGFICYDIAQTISDQKLTTPQITADGTIQISDRSVRSVTLHARQVKSDAEAMKTPSTKPSPIKQGNGTEVKNIGFDSGDNSFSNKARKGGSYTPQR